MSWTETPEVPIEKHLKEYIIKDLKDPAKWSSLQFCDFSFV